MIQIITKLSNKINLLLKKIKENKLFDISIIVS